jgi:hypothetical protein
MKGSVLMSMVGAVVPVLADILARPSIAQTRWVRLPVRRRPQQRTANRGKGMEKTRITKPNNGGPVFPQWYHAPRARSWHPNPRWGTHGPRDRSRRSLGALRPSR